MLWTSDRRRNTTVSSLCLKILFWRPFNIFWTSSTLDRRWNNTVSSLYLRSCFDVHLTSFECLWTLNKTLFKYHLIYLFQIITLSFEDGTSDETIRQYEGERSFLYKGAKFIQNITIKPVNSLCSTLSINPHLRQGVSSKKK